MGTRIQGFRQTQKGKGFSHTRFNSRLRAIQMDGVFGAKNGRAFQSLNFGTKCWKFWDCFRTLGIGFSRLFLNSLGTDFRIVIGPCVLFSCVLFLKMNNMLVVCKLCYYMLI